MGGAHPQAEQLKVGGSVVVAAVARGGEEVEDTLRHLVRKVDGMPGAQDQPRGKERIAAAAAAAAAASASASASAAFTAAASFGG